jgi:hypothetical protein
MKGLNEDLAVWCRRICGASLRTSEYCHRGRGALRRLRRVQRRNRHYDSHVMEHLFSPLDAGWDGAPRHSYQMVVMWIPLRSPNP